MKSVLKWVVAPVAVMAALLIGSARDAKAGDFSLYIGRGSFGVGYGGYGGYGHHGYGGYGHHGYGGYGYRGYGGYGGYGGPVYYGPGWSYGSSFRHGHFHDCW